MEHDVAGGAGAGPAWAVALQQSGLGHALRESLWLYPAVECLHILGFALLVGAIASFDLRVLRGPPPAGIEALAAQTLPVARAGFALAAPRGALLFVTESTAYLANPAFLAKLALAALALLNVLWFHARLGALRRQGDGTSSAGVLRVSALASLLLWAGVLIAGRLIAYV